MSMTLHFETTLYVTYLSRSIICRHKALHPGKHTCMKIYTGITNKQHTPNYCLKTKFQVIKLHILLSKQQLEMSQSLKYTF